MTAGASWVMFAQRDPECFEGRDFAHFGEKEWVEMCYGGDVVQVVLVEDPDGQYWGWIPASDDQRPEMVQPHQGLYSMQFPYGPGAEESAGRGRTIRLTVRPACPRCGNNLYSVEPYGCPECGAPNGPEEPDDEEGR